MSLTLVVSSTTVSAAESFTASVSGAQPGEEIIVIYDGEVTAVTADSYGHTPTVVFMATTSAPVIAFGFISGISNVVFVTVTQGFTAQPACYTLKSPPLPWSFAHATFNVTGAPVGARVTFHLGTATGPVVCSAVADSSGHASCSADLNPLQLLNTTYTATVTTPGGQLSSSASLLPCLT